MTGANRYNQRWANSVLMTEYEYEYYSTFQKWPNTNTNIIRFEKGDRIRIRILFGLKKATEYEYEYYSVWKNGPNTNTNIIWLEKITRIRIRILVFGLNYSNKTKNRIILTKQSGRPLKLKVVIRCRKKWNEPNLMYIYHLQCEKMQKIQWNSSNGQFHCFHYVR